MRIISARGFLFGLLWLLAGVSAAQTTVVTLGTGTPVIDPTRAGASIAVVVDGQAYVFDVGDGMVENAIAASEQFNEPALVPQEIHHLFLTHLHSDHIFDLQPLAASRWWRRETPLQVFGPAGLAEYVDAINRASDVEAEIRARGTPPELIADRYSYRAEATEIEDGIVFENDSIQVEAFTVPHGEIRPAFGYRIVTADRTIVISGDTSYSETIAEKAVGADLLFHEVISGDQMSTLTEFWQDYHGSSHTTTTQLARVASHARPGLLVLYHVLFSGASEADVINEIRRDYDGPVVMADDLDVF